MSPSCNCSSVYGMQALVESFSLRRIVTAIVGDYALRLCSRRCSIQVSGYTVQSDKPEYFYRAPQVGLSDAKSISWDLKVRRHDFFVPSENVHHVASLNGRNEWIDQLSKVEVRWTAEFVQSPLLWQSQSGCDFSFRFKLLLYPSTEMKILRRAIN